MRLPGIRESLRVVLQRAGSRLEGKRTCSRIAVVLALFAGELTTTAQCVAGPTISLINPTGTVWRYMAPTTDPGFGTDWKEPLFVDNGSEWLTGRGLFGAESLGLYPFPINTAIPA